jgi:hypothetical protein
MRAPEVDFKQGYCHLDHGRFQALSRARKKIYLPQARVEERADHSQ